MKPKTKKMEKTPPEKARKSSNKRLPVPTRKDGKDIEGSTWTKTTTQEKASEKKPTWCAYHNLK